MAGKGKTHQRILATLEYLRSYTEIGKPIDIKGLQAYLGELSSERAIIYNDLHELEAAGAGVYHDKNKHYYFDNKSFSDGELSLLADVICSSSYLDATSAEKLILHIKQMTNMKKFDDLTRQTDIFLRNKALNSECIHNIDILHEAISRNKQISFSYAKYDEYGVLWYDMWNDDRTGTIKVIIDSHIQKSHDEVGASKGSKPTCVRRSSPYKLVWDNSQCYLIGYNDHYQNFTIFRADKIFDLKITDLDRASIIQPNPFYDHNTEEFDAEKFMRSLYGMYGSPKNELTRVQLSVENKLIGVIFDKFGRDIKLKMYDEDHYVFEVDVQVSNMFFGWLAGFTPSQMRIIRPKKLQIQYEEHLRHILGIE